VVVGEAAEHASPPDGRRHCAATRRGRNVRFTPKVTVCDQNAKSAPGRPRRRPSKPRVHALPRGESKDKAHANPGAVYHSAIGYRDDILVLNFCPRSKRPESRVCNSEHGSTDRPELARQGSPICGVLEFSPRGARRRHHRLRRDRLHCVPSAKPGLERARSAAQRCRGENAA
jgi:hypothetical protein